MAEPETGSLRNVGLLKSLFTAELERVAQGCGWKSFAAQEQIIDRQSETTDVFFVAEGRVRVVNYSVTGREITLDDIDPGGHFGELAAIDSAPCSASVMALMPCKLAMLSQDRFLDPIQNHPQFFQTVPVSAVNSA